MSGTAGDRPRHGGQAQVAPYQNCEERRFVLVGRARRDDELGERAQDNSALEREMPVLQILDVACNTVLDVGIVSRFSAEATHLGEAGNAGFDECADVIVLHESRELVVMLDQMRARADDAHVAAQHIPELRHFIDARSTEPLAERINAFVPVPRLTRELSVMGPHRAKLVDNELPVLHAGTDLGVKKRAGRLEPLRDPDDYRQDRKYEKHDRKRDGKIDRAFEETVERILQRFLAQTNKA